MTDSNPASEPSPDAAGYARDWLELRQPLDYLARSATLVDRLAVALPGRRPLRIVDLACGHGNNLRYLHPRLPGPQVWTAIDHDATLLDWLEGPGRPTGLQLTARCLDLAAGVEDAPWEADVVVTSALLDLVSQPWLASLARRCARDRTPVLAALSVDGRVAFSPGDPDDADVMRWFRQHQHTDRGFGPSPGPDAADCFAQLLEEGGMDVHTARADWHVPADNTVLMTAMVEGIARSSAQVSPRPDVVRAWLERRRVALARASLSMVVGHVDVLGLPAQGAASSQV